MTNPFSNPIYLLSPLVAAAAILILDTFVLLRSRRAFSTWVFFLVLMSIALESLVLFGMRSSPDVYRALPWERAVPILGFSQFLLFYHFTLAYTNMSGQRGLLYAGYSLLAVVTILGPTDLIVKEVRLGDYGYTPVIGPLTPPFFLFYVCLFGAGLYNLFRRYRASSSLEERNHLAFVAIAGMFPLAAALLDAFFDLPPATMWANLIFSVLCAIAIVKYHLLDVSLVVRKGVAYLLLSLMVAIPYIAILYFVNFTFRTVLAQWWIHIIIVLLLAIFLRPIYSKAQHWVDRLFYRDRYDYLVALHELSHQAQSIADVQALASKMVKLLRGAVRASTVSLLLKSESESGFRVASSAGLEVAPSGIILRNNSPLAKWLANNGILLAEKLDIIPQLQSFSHKERSVLERMGAELYVPIASRQGHLSGILVLGKKLSEQPYSAEDRQLLATVSNQMAIALENLRLYQEAKLSERELREKEHEYRQLAESFTDIFFAMDEQLRYTYWNKASEKLMGISAKDALGKHLYDLFLDTEATRRAEQVYLEVLKTREPRYFVNEYRIADKDFLFEISAYPSKGGLVVFAKDITERKRAEEKQKQLQEELNRASRLASIGELAAGVAHEINNPLTGIIGFSQRLLRKSTDPRSKQDLEMIYEEACRAARVVENLRTFARRIEPKKEWVNVNAILEKAIEMRIYELKTSNIAVELDLAPDLPETEADFQQIQQVFLNIIANAEQAITEANRGGKLIIKTEETDGYIRISLIDDGPGISDETLRKLFTPFFTTRGQKGGTGLGLSICHGIVTHHGGKICARSKLGEGATFLVELPVIKKADEGEAQEKARPQK